MLPTLKDHVKRFFFPENKDELKSIIREANRFKKKVTISGNGTGLTGARVPEGGIVVSTEKFNKIIEINTEAGYAVVEPGVLLSEFLNKLKHSGFFYPPDPTEKNCFLGGTVATNASGAKTFKYGPTRNYVLELEVVLPTGDEVYLVRGRDIATDYTLTLTTTEGNKIVIRLPEYELPLTKNAAGYFTAKNIDAIDLFVGSEGTLGIFTKIKLKILPLPEKVISAVIFFDNENDTLKFIEDARTISYSARNNNIRNELDALALEFLIEIHCNFLNPIIQISLIIHKPPYG
jgi:D-lactate dehydrogenase (cytochrome)